MSEKASINNDLEVARNIAEEDRNCKKKQKFSGWSFSWLAYQCTGVIYGDIGTSPPYVYSATFASQPSYDDLVGVLSIIIWSLTLIATIKYCSIVLRAADDGEGGGPLPYTPSSPDMPILCKEIRLLWVRSRWTRVRPRSFILRKIFLELFLFIRENSRAKMAGLDPPIDSLAEVGFLKEI